MSRITFDASLRHELSRLEEEWMAQRPRRAPHIVASVFGNTDARGLITADIEPDLVAFLKSKGFPFEET